MHSPVGSPDAPDIGRPAHGSSMGSAMSSAISSSPNGDAGAWNTAMRRGGAPAPHHKARNASTGLNELKRKRTNSLFKDRSKKLTTLEKLAVIVVDNQIRLSLVVLFTLAALYAVSPQLRPAIDKFHSVSYYNPATGRYGKGADDGYFIFFWIVVFTFLRAAAFDYVFMPFARWSGVNSPKALVRFSEQAWLMAYYFVIWPLGMWLMYDSPYWMNVDQLWTDWPLRELDSRFKWYYLVQFAFWLQQIFVLNIEPRRKDFHQMFAHHIITSSLVAGSYTYHMTRVGNVIFNMIDVGDVFLAIAKNLKYMGRNILCDYAFGVFLISWVIGRHVCFIRVIWSAYKDSVRHIPFGCYTSNSTMPLPVPDNASSYQIIKESFSPSSDVVCFTKAIQMGFIVLLVALQIITLLWFYLILNVAWKVVMGTGAKDTRSDDEDDGEEEDEETEKDGERHLKNGDVLEKVTEPGDKTRATSHAVPAAYANGNGAANGNGSARQY